jgi:hypothetical protein
MTRNLKVVVEVVQFVPIITLASSFIVKGGVDLNQAGTLFVISGAGALFITLTLVYFKVLLNPILLATNLWLLFGAIAFGIPIPLLVTFLSQTNAVLLFAATFGLGIVLTFAAPRTGFIGMQGGDITTVRRLSFILLALAAVALVWVILFKDNIRIGGGLPFIVLNVTRRMLIRRVLK